MILLLIVGVILLIVGYLAPLPYPVPLVLRIAGWIAVAIAAILLIVALLSTHTVAYDALAHVTLHH